MRAKILATARLSVAVRHETRFYLSLLIHFLTKKVLMKAEVLFKTMSKLALISKFKICIHLQAGCNQR